MDLKVLKNKPSWPFETIGVAIAFSPRLEMLLAEAKRLSELFSAKLILIHVGKKSASLEADLQVIITKLGFIEGTYTPIWKEGHPVDTILHVCKDNAVDLLIAGAVERESMLRFYIGSVSREICRKAKCSVLMLTEPSIAGTIFKNIVVNGVEHPKTRHALGTVLYFAQKEKADRVTLVREIHMPAMAMSSAESGTEADKLKQELIEEETAGLHDLLQQVDSGTMKIGVESVFGKTGHAIASYAKQQGADLLVINSTDHHLTILDRLFTHDIEFILADLPCNLLIVHSRVEGELNKLSH